MPPDDALRCPHCSAWIVAPPAPPSPADELRAVCAERGHVVYPGGRLKIRVVADVLARAEGTIRNWQYDEDDPLVPIKVGGRIFYNLADVAQRWKGRA